MSQKTHMFIMAAAFLCLGIGASAAEDVQTPTGETGELVLIPAMKGWERINQGSAFEPRTITFIPEGEKPRDWSQMVTLTTTRTGKQLDPQPIILTFIKSFGEGCSKYEVVAHHAKMESSTSEQSLGVPFSYPAFTALLHCEGTPPPANPSITVKKHEVTWIKVMSGRQFLFMIQKTWHGDEIGPDNVLTSEKTRQEWQDWLDKAVISSIPANSTPPQH